MEPSFGSNQRIHDLNPPSRQPSLTCLLCSEEGGSATDGEEVESKKQQQRRKTAAAGVDATGYCTAELCYFISLLLDIGDLRNFALPVSLAVERSGS